ncbi:MAG: hypothetical protein ACRED1_11170, partial [Limisphaerales bacterium]
MKQKNSINQDNQSSGNQPKPMHGPNESGTRPHLCRSVILAVSGSLVCVAAGQRAAAQSGPAVQTSQTQGLTRVETEQFSPPAVFDGLHFNTDGPWSQPLAAPMTSWVCLDSTVDPSWQCSISDLHNSALWHPAEQLELFSSQRTPASETPSTPAQPAQPAPAAVPPVAVPPAPGSEANSEDTDTNVTLALPALAIPQPKVFKNELSASADFMYGIGTITVPIGYGLKAHALSGATFPVNAISADRSTVYYGGTLSYSYGRSWYLDVSGEDGRSTGSTEITIPGVAGGGAFPASFNVNDTWYQVY